MGKAAEISENLPSAGWLGVARVLRSLPVSLGLPLIQHLVLKLVDGPDDPPGALGGELADACSTETYLKGYLGTTPFFDYAFNKNISLFVRKNMEIAEDLLC